MLSLATKGILNGLNDNATTINRYVLPLELDINSQVYENLEIKNNLSLNLNLENLVDKNVNLKLTDKDINIKKTNTIDINIGA